MCSEGSPQAAHGISVARFEPDEYARTRSAVESGRTPVGGARHLKIIDQDLEMSALTRRDRVIIKLSIRGWSTVSISEHVNLSSSRVDQIIREFFA